MENNSKSENNNLVTRIIFAIAAIVISLYISYIVFIFILAMFILFFVVNLLPGLLASTFNLFSKKSITEYDYTWHELIEKKEAHHIHLYKYVKPGELNVKDNNPVTDIYGHLWVYDENKYRYIYKGKK